MAELSEPVIARSVWMKWGRSGIAAPNIHFFAFESDLLVLLWARGVADAVRFGLIPEDYRSGQTETEMIRVRPE